MRAHLTYSHGRTRSWAALLLIASLLVGGSLPALAAPAAPAGAPLAPDAERYRFTAMWQPEFGDFPAPDSIFFALPYDVAIGPDGSVYVAEGSGDRIRKFTADGAPLAAWGSKGSADGQFDGPHGIATDAAGYVYVADAYNHRIQVFTSTGAFVTKWGTQGPADGQLTTPYGIATGPDGRVYVADTGNHRIQVFTPVGAFVAKWGGQGAEEGRFDTPYGVALDAGGKVYVADSFNHRIQVFTAAGAFVARWGTQGSGDGQFAGPSGVAVGPDGHVYVADTANQRIQKLTSAGAFVTQWGSYGVSEEGKFQFPWGLEAGADGSVYVADKYNNRIQVFTSGGAFVRAWGRSDSYPAHSGRIYYDSHARPDYAVGRFGALLEQQVYDGVKRVRVVRYPDPDLVTYALGNFIYGSGATRTVYAGSRIDHIDWCPDPGNLDQCYTVRKYAYSGAALKTVTLYYPAAGMDPPDREHEQESIALAAGAAGQVHVAVQDMDGRSIQTFTSAGAPAGQWDGGQPGKDFDFWALKALARGPAGSLYVVDSSWDTLYDSYGNPMGTQTVFRIRQFDAAGAVSKEWKRGCGRIASAASVAVDRDGRIYLTVAEEHAVWRFDPDGGEATWGGEGSADGQLLRPEGIAAGPDGRVYVADSGNNRIQVFTAAGAFSAKWGAPGSAAGQFTGPCGIAVDGDGDVYVTEVGNHRVQKFTSAGAYLTRWGSPGDGDGQFAGPRGIAVADDGAVYVLDSGNQRIQAFEATTVNDRFHLPLVLQRAG